MHPPLSDAELVELGEIIKKERKPVLGERSPRSKKPKQEEIQKKPSDTSLVLKEDEIEKPRHSKMMVSAATLKRRASM